MMLTHLRSDPEVLSRYKAAMHTLGLDRVLSSPGADRVFCLYLLGVEHGVKRSASACARVYERVDGAEAAIAEVCKQEVERA